MLLNFKVTVAYKWTNKSGPISFNYEGNYAAFMTHWKFENSDLRMTKVRFLCLETRRPQLPVTIQLINLF